MDTLRGNLSGYGAPDDDVTNYDRDDDGYRELPPAAIGQDERRMQVRAYNFWASLLTDRVLPSIEDLDPHNLPDFGPNSVLLDFSLGIEDPAIVFLGEKLAAECGTSGPIAKLSDVPSRSLLSRITDHHLQIIANQAPIGFEAEFVNHRGVPIMYRGILLPFSSDDDTIDFIFGVINWKEIADQQTTDNLLQEIDAALNAGPQVAPGLSPLAARTDSPADASVPIEAMDELEDDEPDHEPETAVTDSGWSDIPTLIEATAGQGEPEPEVPAPIFGRRRRGLIAEETADDWSQVPAEPAADDDFHAATGASDALLPQAQDMPIDPPEFASAPDLNELEPAAFDITPEPAEIGFVHAYDDPDTLDLAGFAEFEEAPAAAFEAAPLPLFTEDAGSIPAQDTFAPALETFAPALDTFASEFAADTASLADWLAQARDLALAAEDSANRSRQSLYAAIGRAYDFSLAASADPEGLAELVADAGLTMQERAPMTPVVKLVFGADYDKTRLTEYAAVLSHAWRLDIACGELENWLADVPGGLKAVVQLERKLRREESGSPKRETPSAGERLARKLRKLDHRPLAEVAAGGSEFTLLVARRLDDGSVVLLGEVADDMPLLERAARRLVA